MPIGGTELRNNRRLGDLQSTPQGQHGFQASLPIGGTELRNNRRLGDLQSTLQGQHGFQASLPIGGTELRNNRRLWLRFPIQLEINWIRYNTRDWFVNSN
ncbi:hypothetical protein [Candidatus Nitrospira salsa]